MLKSAQNSWERLWRSLKAQGDFDAQFRALCDAYASPPRAYHNLEHISDCLAEFDGARQLAANPDAIELALWFHDAVYDSKAKDNEERSADLAEQALKSARLPDDLISTVRELILATKHNAPPKEGDTSVLVDVDLSILGQPRAKFERYEKAIREEYNWVSNEAFAAGRAAVLQSFLDRPFIYSTEFFRAKYEQPARENMNRSLQLLRHGS